MATGNQLVYLPSCMAPYFLLALVFAIVMPFQFKFRPSSPISWKGGGCYTQADPDLLACGLCSLKVILFIKLAGLALAITLTRIL